MHRSSDVGSTILGSVGAELGGSATGAEFVLDDMGVSLAVRVL